LNPTHNNTTADTRLLLFHFPRVVFDGKGPVEKAVVVSLVFCRQFFLKILEKKKELKN
jgi:hypothetical protein